MYTKDVADRSSLRAIPVFSFTRQTGRNPHTSMWNVTRRKPSSGLILYALREAATSADLRSEGLRAWSRRMRRAYLAHGMTNSGVQFREAAGRRLNIKEDSLNAG